MGVVAETLKQLLTQQLAEHGVVLWFDPERHYETVTSALAKPEWHFAAFNGSYYQLRAEVESLVRGLEPPRLLLYLPTEHNSATGPLAELLALGTVLGPGAAGAANTRLSVIAKKALKGLVSEARLADLDEQIRKGQLTLADLEQLADEAGEAAAPTVLSVVFGKTIAEDVVLDFAASAERDAEVEAKNAKPELTGLLENRFGLKIDVGQALPAVRSALIRQALCAELLEMLGDDAPASLKAVWHLNGSVLRRRCARLAGDWRNRRDLAGSYAEAATSIEKSLHLHSIAFGDGALERVRTFESMERTLLRRVAMRLMQGDDEAALQLALDRRKGFWAGVRTDLLAEWTLIAQAAELLRTAGEVETALEKPLGFQQIVECYTRDEKPWSRLDTLHRRLEKRASSLEFALSEPPEEIERLVAKARHRYADVAGHMAERFLRGWQATGFVTSGRYRQTQVFETFVEPLARQYRTAYLMVDALRLELAHELPALLEREFDSRIEVVFGTAPSVTEVGMAALLPRAATGLELKRGAKLQVVLHGETLRNRQDRIDTLKKSVELPVVDLRLEDPKNFKKKLKELGEGPALVVVTSREIDQSGEDQTTETREHMERVLTHLVLALRTLAENGIERFVVTADHGYIFGEELGESDKIDPPGGTVALLHRRVWVGEGGAASASYMRSKLNCLGAQSDLEIAVPWNLAGFKTAGPTAYFHGGLSPQEILLPVLTLTPRSGFGGTRSKNVAWELTVGSKKITSRFLSVTVSGQSEGLFHVEWSSVRVEARSAGEVCSIPVSATYGYNEATGEVAVKPKEGESQFLDPNTVAMMLTSKAPSHGTISVHLLDAMSGVELKRIENVEVALAI